MSIDSLPTGGGLLALFLSEQQSLTAVERFSAYHDESNGHGQERYYRNLLPVREPLPGEQFAFEVDLDRCSGCKACVTACHSLNGLDDDETWRSVGLLHDPAQKRMQQTVTTACHHCADPACANGCPTLAYEKDPVTGIVKHLDDQCFGCQYCLLKCPYDVPQYSKKRGIVRKCDMCVGRLRAGEAPACVQACPTQAIRIVLVETKTIGLDPDKSFGLAGTPDPAYTKPTTRYVSKHGLQPALQPVDAHQIRPEHAHMPLVFMLVASQMAAGFWIFHALRTMTRFVGASGPSTGSGTALTPLQHPEFPITESIGLALVFLSLGLSLLHLGRPMLAWKAFLGWRRSWLSREVIAFGGLAGTASLTLLLSLIKWFNSVFPPIDPGLFSKPALALSCLAGTSLMCLAVLYASAMVYRDTPRPLWATRLTLWRFSLSAILCGGAVYFILTGWKLILFILPVTLLVKLALEARVLNHREDDDPNPLWKAAQLITNQLGRIWRLRVTLGLIGGAGLPLLMASGIVSGSGLAIWALFITLLIAAGELLERYLFFTTGIAPRMPGGR